MYYTDFSDIPRHHYGIIYSDPPWTYRDKALAGNRGAGCKYDLMGDADLAAMPMGGITTGDAVCFMWATMPKLPEALALMAAWGFTYKTVAFTWVKRNRKSPSWFWGMGRWTRANAELVLLGTKGRPHRCNAGVSSVLDMPVAGHSRKPIECRRRIDALMGPAVPRIELFARGAGPTHWDRYGNTPVYNAGSEA